MEANQLRKNLSCQDVELMLAFEMNEETKHSVADWYVKVSVNVCCNHPFFSIFQKNGTQYKFDCTPKKSQNLCESVV